MTTSSCDCPGCHRAVGSPDRGQRKATVLLALLKQKAATYDVSAPDAPAISG